MTSFKLATINTNLALSGNSEVNTEEDGSDEWRVGSESYEEAVKYLLGEHDWKFATTIDQNPDRTGDPLDTTYTDAYAKPANCLGIIWVKVNEVSADWRLVGNQIYINAPSGVTVKYYVEPDPEEFPLMFVSALHCRTRAGIYEGLNEDPDEARKLRSEAEGYLAKARTRVDRQESPRRVFRSRILARRRGAISTVRVSDT